MKFKIMNTRKCIMLAVVCVFALTACKNDDPKEPDMPGFGMTPPPFVPSPSLPLPDPDPIPDPAPEPEEARRQTLEYFHAQLDQDNIGQPPSFLYGQIFTPDEAETEGAAMWALWKEANTDRLQESGIMNFIATGDTVIWDIPAGQRMKALLLAKGEKPANGYKLFINLHGGGRASLAESAWDSYTNTLAWEAEMKRAKVYDDAPSMYFVPRMADDRIGRWYLAPQRTAFRRVFQLGVLSGYADPDSVYILGTSEGGYGSHRLALFMPDYFAGAGPMAAAEPLAAAENLRNIAFGLEVGETDAGFKRNEYAQLWKDELDRLQRLSPNDFVHRVDIQEGKGHGNTDFTVMTPWLKKFSRRTYPKHLSYQYRNLTPDYWMESYSSGVYYLDFRGLMHTQNANRSFDLVMEGNEIRITTQMISGGDVWGDLGIYLDPTQIDLTQPITVYIDRRISFQGMAKISRGILAESIALFGDPKRIYPAKVRVLIY